MQVRVIALGQTAAGDDGAGFAVLEELHHRGVPPGVELVRTSDAVTLMSLLETSAMVVIVDAAVGGAPGEVIELGPEQLPSAGLHPLSSHGIGMEETIALARLLNLGGISPAIRIVAITVAPPKAFGVGLSPVAASTIRIAAERVRHLIATTTAS